MNLVINKNKGIIKISRACIKDAEIMASFLSFFDVIKLELDIASGNYYYMYCESDLFSDVKENEPIPFYDVTLKREGERIFVSDVNQYK